MSDGNSVDIRELGCDVMLGDRLSGALFSKCEQWRYGLWRVWNNIDTSSKPRRIAFVGLNPSTADESKDDPTIRRCIRYAKEWGYDGMYMLNAYGFRSTDPKGLWKVEDPVGPATDFWLKWYASESDTVLACWGGNIKGDREGKVCDVLNRQLMCLGTTQAGNPRHPLYLPKVLTPEKWPKPCPR
jgi:hypothetical protein